MRVLYLVIGNYFTESTIGVSNKIVAKINAFNEAGMITELLVYGREEPQIKVPFGYSYQKAPVSEGFFDGLSAIMPQLNSKFEIILTRYPFADKTFVDFVRKFPETIVFEHNTIEENEALLLQKRHFKKLDFSFSRSYFRYFFNTYVSPKTSESEYGRELIGYARAGIAVTREIENYERRRCSKYRITTISNGVSVQDQEPLPLSDLNTEINCFMLIGTYASWHGVDRIVKGLDKYKGEETINVFLYGITEAELSQKPVNPRARIICCPKMKAVELRKDLAKMHFAFSSLAMHRIKLKEAASLKLRESMLMGFPVVLGYTDVDLAENKELAAYSYQVSPDDRALDFSEIIRFLKNLRRQGNYQQQISAKALAQFSFAAKAKNYYSFFKELIPSGRAN